MCWKPLEPKYVASCNKTYLLLDLVRKAESRIHLWFTAGLNLADLIKVPIPLQARSQRGTSNIWSSFVKINLATEIRDDIKNVWFHKNRKMVSLKSDYVSMRF